MRISQLWQISMEGVGWARKSLATWKCTVLLCLKLEHSAYLFLAGALFLWTPWYRLPSEVHWTQYTSAGTTLFGQREERWVKTWRLLARSKSWSLGLGSHNGRIKADRAGEALANYGSVSGSNVATSGSAAHNWERLLCPGQTIQLLPFLARETTSPMSSLPPCLPLPLIFYHCLLTILCIYYEELSVLPSFFCLWTSVLTVPSTWNPFSSSLPIHP